MTDVKVESTYCFHFYTLYCMRANRADDSSRWTEGFVYKATVNSIKSAAAMEMIEA